MRKLFKDKKVLIMGLGLHGGGVGAAKFFCSQEAKVSVTDLKTKEQLKESVKKLERLPIKYFLGHHREEDFINSDLIVKNPDVPDDSPFILLAKKNNIPVKTDVDIFFDLAKCQMIGVTGTKGKSTTATLIYYILKSKYKDTVLAGNIGVSPLEILSKIKKSTKVVLELSSFELEGLKKSPQTAVITNIFQDHLNRYKDMADYVRTKKTIFEYQKPTDVLILNYEDSILRELASEANSRVYFFSAAATPGKNTAKIISFADNGNIFGQDKKTPLFNLSGLKIYGKHNVYDVLAAVSVAEIFKIPPENIQKVLREFKGVPHRQEFVAEKNEVKYFNDTSATVPDATIQALKTFSEKFPRANIILIAGGQNKNLEYKILAKEISKKIVNLVLLPGTASDKIKRELNKNVNVISANSMEEAVVKSSQIAKPGDIVLLSPSAASFNLFKNEFDRGDQFKKFVNNLK